MGERAIRKVCKGRRLYSATVQAFLDSKKHGINSVIVYFTATPVIRGKQSVSDAKKMLELVKGIEYSGKQHGDEGFISWYMERPASLFARITHATKVGLDSNL